MRRLVRPLGMGLLATSGLLAVCAAVEHRLELRDSAEMRAHATFFSVEGRSIRYRLVEADRPGATVVFVSGVQATLEQWKYVQAGLATVAPSLAYDPGGVGFSDPMVRHDAEAMADELATLANLPGAKPPFVIVSYSASAFTAAAFAKAHPDLLGGLVFLDPTPPEQVIRLSLRQLYHRRAFYERKPLVLTAKALVGWSRFRYQLSSAPSDPVDESLERTSHWWANYLEGVDIGRSAEEAEIDWSKVHVPVVVVSTGHRDGDSVSSMRYRAHQRMAEQAGGRFVHQPSWDHGMIPQPPSAGEVVKLIAEVVVEARARTLALAGERPVEEGIQAPHVLDR